MSSEKISSTVCQGFWKEQKRNSDVYQTEYRKGNANDYHAMEKRRAREQKKEHNRGKSLILQHN